MGDDRPEIEKSLSDTTIDDYHGIILSYDEKNGFYECCIDGQKVRVKEDGNYYECCENPDDENNYEDEGGNPKKIEGWEKLKRAFHEAHMKQIQVNTRKNIGGAMSSSVINKEEVGKTENNTSNDDQNNEKEFDEREWKKERQRLGYYND